MAICGTQVAEDSTAPHFLQGRGSDDRVLSFTKSKVTPTIPQCLECCTLSSSGLSGYTEKHPQSALEEWKQLHPGSFSQSSSHPQRPHSSSCRTPRKTLGKHGSHVGLGPEAEMHFIICLLELESRVLTVLWLLHVSVSKSKVFLERLYFSPTKYFIFIAKLNFPRPLTIQGTLAP